MLKLERTVSEGSTRSDSEQNPASPTGSQPRAHSAQNGSASERGHHRRASSGRGVFKSSSRKNLINRHRSHSFRSGQGERSALAGFPQASSPAQTDDQLTSMSSVMRHGGNCSAIPNTGSSRLNLAVDPDMMYAPLDIFSLTRIEFPGPSAGPISQFEDRGFVAGKPEDIMQLGAAASILGRRGPPSSRHTWGSQAFHTYGGSARHLGS